jgi:hypothetical protein
MVTPCDGAQEEEDTRGTNAYQSLDSAPPFALDDTQDVRESLPQHHLGILLTASLCCYLLIAHVCRTSS